MDLTKNPQKVNHQIMFHKTALRMLRVVTVSQPFRVWRANSTKLLLLNNNPIFSVDKCLGSTYAPRGSCLELLANNNIYRRQPCIPVLTHYKKVKDCFKFYFLLESYQELINGKMIKLQSNLVILLI